MLEQFKEHIENQFPELLTGPFLLACSGGVDSVVLVHLCARSNMDFVIAHCNFLLRAPESDKDEQLVRELATSLSKKFVVRHFDTIGYIRKNKVSLQVAARELRYTWFARVMKENNLGMLITAHHADDNLETFLINLSRGTGIDGLTGIPSKTDTISRPMLPFSRERILAYAEAEKLVWREDSSNAETKYLRNRIRHQIVPVLKELHPTFLDNFILTQSHLADTASIVDSHANSLKEKLFTAGAGVIKINIRDLQQLRPLKAYLYVLFKGYGFTAWNDVLGLLTADSGKEVRSKTHRLIKDREHLLLEEHRQCDATVYQIGEGQSRLQHPVNLAIEEVDAMDKNSNTILYVDKETLKYPLTVRKWEKGDYFHPLGMKGRKKLSKYFKDEKIDVISKEKQWLLCSDSEIVWVIGKRADDRFKVTDQTKHILKFKLNK